MSQINDSISRVRSLLLGPKDQRPNLDVLFTNLTYEFQNFVNELSNSGKIWSYNTVPINVNPGTTDYIVPGASGKVLFVIAYPLETNNNPVSLEFADLADVSADYWLYSPLDFAISRDFNEAWSVPFPFQIAFFRKGADLWFRLPPFAYTLTRIDVVFSTGDWIANLSTGDEAVLSQHHQLVEVRSSMNLLPAAEWWDDDTKNENRRKELALSLSNQEQRYARQFVVAKRTPTRDLPVVRAAFGDEYF